MTKHLQASFKILVILLFLVTKLPAQTGAPNSFRYQAIARDASGIAITNQAITVRTGIYSGSATGILEWEETHAVSTDADGLYLINIGLGTSTGNGSLASFPLIDWAAAGYYLKIKVDFGSGYNDFGTTQLFSVPYSFYSTKTGTIQNISINDLADVDTAGIKTGHILKWDGINWKPYKDNYSDTVSYALKAGYTPVVDSAKYAIHVINPSVDTVSFAYRSDSSIYSLTTGYAPITSNSTHSDTATYSYNYLPYNWSISGNSPPSGKFLGTTSNINLAFKTSTTEKMRIDSNGRLAVGIISPIASTHFVGNDGFISQGSYGGGSLPDSSYNTRLMWYPKKAALRIGEINSNRWNNSNIGDYSTAAGYNTQASGIYSIAMGCNSVALNENCISIGRYCSTNISGVISNGGSIAMGDSCTVTETRSLAMGYKNRSYGGIVMGYKNFVYWASQTSIWGANNYSTGDCAISFGSNTYMTTSAKCSFVFSDTSSTKLFATVNYQFKVRASGGVIFYSDPTLTNGIILFPGGGAWASVSDKKKKENFKHENPEDILKGITKLKITSWNYKSEDTKIRHLGPMAQQFYSTFGIGESKVSICTIDIDGVSMIGIKALEKRTSDLSEKLNGLNQLKTEIKNIDNFDDLNMRISQIEKTLQIEQ